MYWRSTSISGSRSCFWVQKKKRQKRINRNARRPATAAACWLILKCGVSEVKGAWGTWMEKQADEHASVKVNTKIENTHFLHSIKNLWRDKNLKNSTPLWIDRLLSLAFGADYWQHSQWGWGRNITLECERNGLLDYQTSDHEQILSKIWKIILVLLMVYAPSSQLSHEVRCEDELSNLWLLRQKLEPATKTANKKGRR